MPAKTALSRMHIAIAYHGYHRSIPRGPHRAMTYTHTAAQIHIAAMPIIVITFPPPSRTLRRVSGQLRCWQKRYSILSPGKSTFRTFSASGYVKSVSPLILFRAVFSEHPIVLIMSFTVRPFRCISAFKLSIAYAPFIRFNFTVCGKICFDFTSLYGNCQYCS